MSKTKRLPTRDQVKTADTWDLSRGAAAKRLVGLAVCGLTDAAYNDVDEIRQISAGNFESALQHVYVEIVERERDGRQTLESEERQGVVREVLQRYRLMHGLTEQSTERRPRVKVRR